VPNHRCVNPPHNGVHLPPPFCLNLSSTPGRWQTTVHFLSTPCPFCGSRFFSSRRSPSYFPETAEFCGSRHPTVIPLSVATRPYTHLISVKPFFAGILFSPCLSSPSTSRKFAGDTRRCILCAPDRPGTILFHGWYLTHPQVPPPPI